MSWKDQFKRLKNEWSNFNNKPASTPTYQQQQQQQQQPQPQFQNAYPPQQQQQQQQQQQYSYDRPPPPPPLPQQQQPAQWSPFPSQPQPPIPQPANTVYWQPIFGPGLPVTQEWDAKEGNNNGWGNNEIENYTSNPENAFFTNDHKLVIRAITNTGAADPAQRYTSARLVSRQTLARDRGVVTAVITSPCAWGIWPAFWLLPQEPFAWPYDGEVDVMETWNGDRLNHSCLHWGYYNAKDRNKHITKTTILNRMDSTPVRYDFAWDQPGGQPGQGRMIWWIDGQPVMKTSIPKGTRPMREWTLLLNIAMGGNVCQGQLPRDGACDMVVHHLAMSAEPEFGGWPRFEDDWMNGPDGQVG